MDLDLELGHGFIPRIGEENYKAVDRCVGPADLFNPDRLDLPWAIIDGAWAEGRPELLNTLRNHETKLLVDTHGWRYRYGATSEVAKLTTTSWSPGGAVSLADKAGGRLLVEASVRAQSALGADAYLIPGWCRTIPPRIYEPPIRASSKPSAHSMTSRHDRLCCSSAATPTGWTD